MPQTVQKIAKLAKTSYITLCVWLSTEFNNKTSYLVKFFVETFRFCSIRGSINTNNEGSNIAFCFMDFWKLKVV